MNIVQHNNEDIGSIYPLPLNQQPIQEYWRLRKRRFLRWAILERGKYATKLLAVWISNLLLVLFVYVLRSHPRQFLYAKRYTICEAVSFRTRAQCLLGQRVSDSFGFGTFLNGGYLRNESSSPQQTVSQYGSLSHADILMSAIIAKVMVFLSLLKLYSAWHSIYLRLISRKIDYKILVTQETRWWQKSELVSTRDILVARFQVRPILKRLQRSIFNIGNNRQPQFFNFIYNHKTISFLS